MSDENRHFGLQTENRFYYAMKSLPAALRPRWFFKFREATNREDGEGTDFFAGLDVGEAPLQVKSSEVGLLKYILEDHPDKDAIVIVVKPTDSPEAYPYRYACTACRVARKPLTLYATLAYGVGPYSEFLPALSGEFFNTTVCGSG